MTALRIRPARFALGVLALALLAGGAWFFGWRGAQPPPLTLEALGNATYEFERGSVTLHSGTGRREAVADTDAVTLTLVHAAFGDLDGDGAVDAAAVLTAHWGGSGFLYFLVPVYNEAGQARPQGAGVRLGDRVVVRGIAIRDRTVALELLRHGPNDPSCCPTELRTLRYRVESRQLRCEGESCAGRR